MIQVVVRFGVGYGEHEITLEFDDGTPEEQIEEEASDAARERFWWSHEIQEPSTIATAGGAK